MSPIKRLKRAKEYLRKRALKGCSVTNVYYRHIDKIPIKPFAHLSRKDYYIVRRIICDYDNKIKLPRDYPFTSLTLEKIRSKLQGLYLGDVIYVKTTDTIKEIASTIIHELNHYCSGSEVDAMTAEWHFEYPLRRLTRSQSKKIRANVDKLY